MRHQCALGLLAFLAACGDAPSNAPGGGDGDPSVDLGDEVDQGGGPGDDAPDADVGPGDGGAPDAAGADGGPLPLPGASVAPGGACACDDDCQGDEEHAGLCIHGICGTHASARECQPGSRAECPEGQRCWSGTGDGVCYPDFVEGQCAGQRDGDGSCVTSGDDCYEVCGALCDRAGEPGGGDGDGGGDGGGGDGPLPDDCPEWECEGPECEVIVEVPGSRDPDSEDASARGYYIETDPAYGFLRGDALRIMQWAACEMRARHPGLPPLALLDMTTTDGRTPGCEDGADSCRHPGSTHQGTDVDAAYYQTDGANDGQIICGDGSDDNGNGQSGTYNDGYFCTTEDNVVDVDQQIEFIELLDSTGMLRVIGVDQTLADDLEPSGAVLGFGNAGGWAFHHHHVHASFVR